MSKNKLSRRCPSCGRRGTIKYNSLNKVTQCHNCGYVVKR